MRHRSHSRLALLSLALGVACSDVPTAPAEHRPSGIRASQGSLAAALTDVPASGTNTEGGTFSGSWDVVGFEYSSGGQLLANLTLSGTLRDANGNVLLTLTDQPFNRMPVSLTGSCGSLTMTIGSLDVSLLGLHLYVAPSAVDLSGQSGTGNLLCAALSQRDHGGSPEGLLNALNQMLVGHD